LGIFARPRKGPQRAVKDSEDEDEDDDMIIEDGQDNSGEVNQDRPQDEHREVRPSLYVKGCGPCGSR